MVVGALLLRPLRTANSCAICRVHSSRWRTVPVMPACHEAPRPCRVLARRAEGILPLATRGSSVLDEISNPPCEGWESPPHGADRGGALLQCGAQGRQGRRRGRGRDQRSRVRGLVLRRPTFEAIVEEASAQVKILAAEAAA